MVLEGGAMRGLFTAGILDYLLQQGILAKRTIGVSAGALVGYSYVCGAMGRTAYINLKYCADRRYLSASNILLTGDALGIDFTFNRIPNEFEHFDMADIFSSPMKLTSVASDLELGEADYHDVEPTDHTGYVGKDHNEVDANLAYLIASSAMPLASHRTFVDGKTLLDGGVCDSVPITYSIMRGLAEGIYKHVVILTQDPGYVKQPNKASVLVARHYSQYPYFVERFENRHHDYNRVYRKVERMADAGKIFLYRPQKPVEVSTLESDQDKLLDLYLEGYSQAAERFDELCRYLEID
ncbi:MAG: patatin-like phospholipase family protein [Eggerthellaceae bacterium]